MSTKESTRDVTRGKKSLDWKKGDNVFMCKSFPLFPSHSPQTFS